MKESADGGEEKEEEEEKKKRRGGLRETEGRSRGRIARGIIQS